MRRRFESTGYTYPQILKVSNFVKVSVEEILTFKPPTGNESVTKTKRVLRKELDCAGIKLNVLNGSIGADWRVAVLLEKSERGGLVRQFKMSKPGSSIQHPLHIHCIWDLQHNQHYIPLSINLRYEPLFLEPRISYQHNLCTYAHGIAKRARKSWLALRRQH